MQRQDAKGRADPSTPEELGAPRGRTQRPLTAEQQKQQEKQEQQVRSLDQEEPLEQEMDIHSRTLAWISHGQRSVGGYSPRGCKESDTTELLSTHACIHPTRHFPQSCGTQSLFGASEGCKDK